MKKTIQIIPDKFTDYVAEAFDYSFDGKSVFDVPNFIKPSDGFGVGLIVGSSGSGKTTILKKDYGYNPISLEWDESKAIVSHFDTPENAVERCFAVGLGSIPTLCRPFHVLSNGEQFRATMARCLQTGMIMDEFTSVVNRETAKSLCVAIKKYIAKKQLKNIVLASCHTDIIEFLNPDWIFDCDNGIFLNTIKPNDGLKKIATVEWHV